MPPIMLTKFLAAGAPDPLSRFGRQPLGLRLLLTFLAYLAAARLTSAIGTTGFGLLVPFWPPAGIALAAMLLGGRQLWPAVLLATLASALFSGFSFAAGLCMGLGNTLGAWAACHLLRKLLAFSPTLDRPRDVMHLCFSAPALSGALSALVGMATLYASGQVAASDLATAWRSWWVGDIAGAQLMAPFILAWLQPREAFGRNGWRDYLALAAVLLLTIASLDLYTPEQPEVFTYSRLLLLLALIWLAFNCDLRLVTLALVGIALIAAFFAAARCGPFSDLNLTDIQIRLQILIAAISTMTLALAAANRQRRTAEEDLSRVVSQLDEVLDSLDDVVWTLDPASGRYTYLSGAIGRLFRRPIQDFYDDPELWLRQVVEEDRPTTLAAFRQVFEHEVEHSFRITDGNGQIRWMRARGRPVRDGEGRLLRIDGITQDITSLHQATSQLAASEERLRRALGASEVGVWDWEVAAGALNFVLAVPAGQQYGLEEHCLSLAEWEASLHQEDRERALKALTDCREGRSPRFHCEYRMRTRQGHWRWYRGEGQVVENDAAGRALRLAGTFRDIHERRQVEGELEKLSMAVEQNPSVVFITDDQGQFEYCNQAFSEVTGYALEDILGQTPRLLKSGLNERATYSELWRTICAGQTWRGRLLNRRRDGSIYVCLQTIAPIRDGNGRTTHFVSISQDLSELQEAPGLWSPRRSPLNPPP